MLTNAEAAALLSVSPSTLHAWEQRFGFPRPTASLTGQRLYADDELTALQDGLIHGLSVAAAIAKGRDAQRTGG